MSNEQRSQLEQRATYSYGPGHLRCRRCDGGDRGVRYYHPSRRHQANQQRSTTGNDRAGPSTSTARQKSGRAGEVAAALPCLLRAGRRLFVADVHWITSARVLLRSMYGSPDGVSQFQYPGMARSLGVILRRRPCFFDNAGSFESLAGVVRRRSRHPRIPTSEPGLRHGQHPRCDASGATARAASKNGLGAECTETAKTDTAPVLPSFI